MLYRYHYLVSYEIRYESGIRAGSISKGSLYVGSKGRVGRLSNFKQVERFVKAINAALRLNQEATADDPCVIHNLVYLGRENLLVKLIVESMAIVFTIINGWALQALRFAFSTAIKTCDKLRGMSCK